MFDLVDRVPEMMIVVVGFNSSNTSHLQEISEQRNIPSFWVDSHERIDSQNNCLMHRLSYGELVETEGFMPGRPVRIGVTSGASTPDAVIDSVLEKVLEAQKKARADSASQQPVAA
jgi:4-hydroxy-3-methylbut-2-enyl diphosphate reductase